MSPSQNRLRSGASTERDSENARAGAGVWTGEGSVVTGARVPERGKGRRVVVTPGK